MDVLASESALDAFLTGLATGLSESLSDPDDEESFLDALDTFDTFLTGLASDESESLDESFFDAFLAGAAAFLTGLASEESESDEDSTFFAFCGTAAFSEVFCALTGFASDESESDELDSTFFLVSFLVSLTTALACLLLSTLCFLLGGSLELELDDDEDATFFDF